MVWHFNLLRVEGPAAGVNDFARRVRTALERANHPPLVLPLFFGSLDPCPPELEINEEQMGKLAYDAFYGNFGKVLDYPGIRGRKISTRVDLCAFLDSRSNRYRRLADRYDYNERTHGHRTWLTWNVEHYGTKWDLGGETKVERVSEECLEYFFQTIDSPPYAWVDLAARRFSNLTLTLLDALEPIYFDEVAE